MNDIVYYRSERLELIHKVNCMISYPRHNHSNMFVIGIVIKGRILLEHNRDRQIKISSDYFIISPYEIHAMMPIDNEPYDLLCLCIEKTFVDKISLFFLQQLIKDNIDPSYLVCDNRQPLIDSLGHVISGLKQRQIVFKLRLSAATRFFTMLHEFDRKLINGRIVIADKTLITRCGLDQPYKRRYFKNCLGLSPVQYYQQRRIRHAALLVSQHYPLTMVAQLCGFYDQSHFNRFFKQLVRMTPKAYSESVCLLTINTVPE